MQYFGLFIIIKFVMLQFHCFWVILLLVNGLYLYGAIRQRNTIFTIRIYFNYGRVLMMSYTYYDDKSIDPCTLVR